MSYKATKLGLVCMVLFFELGLSLLYICVSFVTALTVSVSISRHCVVTLPQMPWSNIYLLWKLVTCTRDTALNTTRNYALEMADISCRNWDLGLSLGDDIVQLYHYCWWRWCSGWWEGRICACLGPWVTEQYYYRPTYFHPTWQCCGRREDTTLRCTKRLANNIHGSEQCTLYRLRRHRHRRRHRCVIFWLALLSFVFMWTMLFSLLCIDSIVLHWQYFDFAHH